VSDSPADAYKVLQVDSEAEDEVIQAAYRRLAQKYHPDVVAPGPGSESGGRMTAINKAYEVLRDPERRRAYDRERRAAAAAASGGMGAAGGSPAANPAARPAGPSSASRPTGARRTAPGSRHSEAEESSPGDWTSGRSSHGGGYNPAEMRTKDGFGAAGRPPGEPSGSVLNFGRFAGWSLGEIARRDLDYVEWLDRSPIGRQYRDEIDGILRKAGRRKSAGAEAQERRGLFRRR
jgi:curved DNA-binding protein CbpA